MSTHTDRARDGLAVRNKLHPIHVEYQYRFKFDNLWIILLDSGDIRRWKKAIMRLSILGQDVYHRRARLGNHLQSSTPKYGSTQAVTIVLFACNMLPSMIGSAKTVMVDQQHTWAESLVEKNETRYLVSAWSRDAASLTEEESAAAVATTTKILEILTNTAKEISNRCRHWWRGYDDIISISWAGMPTTEREKREEGMMTRQEEEESKGWRK
jgi:hypothetical protein